MSMLDREQIVRLTEAFLAEAGEHLASITSCLMKVEQSADSSHTESVETIYRCAHSLKGGARIVDFSLVELICQSLEDCFQTLKQKTIKPDKTLLDLLHDAVDTIERILSSPSPQAPPTALKVDSIGICKRLDEAARALAIPTDSVGIATLDEPASAEREPRKTEPTDISPPKTVITSVPRPAEPVGARQAVDKPPAGATETVRIPIAKLDQLLAEAEELVALKLIFRQQTRDLKEIIDMAGTVRRGLGNLKNTDKSVLLELDRNLGTLIKRVAQINRSNEQDRRLSENIIDTIIADTKSLLMLPVSTVTQGLHKLVRDCARIEGKTVELIISGDSIELDRRILQELKDPLIHLLRNCIDHGIEPPANRQATGKPVTARIRIDISANENSKVAITISDDGTGIDTAEIRETALRTGVISPECLADMTDNDLHQLIFNSGFSTRSEVSMLSGRGLGLAIVRESLDKLGGGITVESTAGTGTTFNLVVPISLATIRGIYVRAGARVFAVPTLHVQKVCRVRMSDIKAVGTKNTIVVDNQTIRLVALAALLGLPVSGPAPGDSTFAMLLGQGDNLFGLQIDEVLSEDDLLVKGIGPLLPRVRNIAGATILANGDIVPILNVMDLLRNSDADFIHYSHGTTGEVATSEKSTKKRILVVDDSITSRTLIMNVLESYGYEVKTAVDGLDGLATLQGSEGFDLATVDVEMPHMNGFELTARIRADERLSRLPVVLITSLDSAEDKKKGIHSGADAYIVKSGFDQTSLLDIIRKLI